MDSRERIFRALAFETPDRVPVDFWASAGLREKLKQAFGTDFDAFLDEHDVDLRYIPGPEYIGPPLQCFDDGSDEDLWGVRRKSVAVATKGGAESYKEVVHAPLASAERVEDVLDYARWPSPDWFDYSGIARQCEDVRERGRVAVFMGDRLNRLAQLKPAMYLRGVDTILMDMAIRPEVAAAVFGKIRAFYVAYAERIFEAARGKLDLLLMGDDFGTQSGPFVSPAMWEAFLGPGFAEYCALAKTHGVKVMHHTCGSVRPIIPLMMECGLDVLQSLQPEAAEMAPADLKREFGGRLAFHGGISIQQTLPFGSEEDVRQEVRERIEALAPGGGYILCTSHNIQADAPVENVEALLCAYREFGDYA